MPPGTERMNHNQNYKNAEEEIHIKEQILPQDLN